MAIFALEQTVNFYRNQDTPVYMCIFDAKNVFFLAKNDFLGATVFFGKQFFGKNSFLVKTVRQTLCHCIL